MSTLPAPSADQLAHSQHLAALIADQITAAGGWLPFDRYMDAALYQPGWGYYSAGSRKFGAAGDFVTAPDMGSLVAESLANTVATVLAACGGGEVLEVGAGTGALARDLLLALEAVQLPTHYRILEVSPDLAARQRETLEAGAPHLLSRVSWCTTLPSGFVGCMVGNEVLDAMPCRLVRWTQGQWWERGVGLSATGLVWAERPLADLAAAAHLPTAGWPDDYLTEIQPTAAAFVASLAHAVEKGALLLVDYGFDAATYYHPERNEGTLMCHYRHHSHDDPLWLPGLQDITTHVDFSAIWQAATDAGWALEGYTAQASFLLDAGLLEALSRRDPQSTDYLRQAAYAQKLLSPAEMGELFKVIGFSRNLPLTALLPGFGREDRSGGL